MRKILIIAAIFLITSFSVQAKTLQDGVSLYKSGNYNMAEAVFRELIAATPYDYTAQYMLAITLVNLQKQNEAKQLYKNVIEKSNNESLASLCRTGLNNLGVQTQTASYSGINKAILNVNIAGGVIVVNDVTLNNNLKTKFVLDTGATFTTISKQTASKLKISTNGVKTLKIMTGSGYISAPLVKIPVVEVKGLTVYNVDAIVTDLPVHTSGDAQGLSGLLGLSFLEKFKITVDRANNIVILEKN